MSFIHNHKNDVLHITTVLEKGIGDRGQDESLDLREFDAVESVLEWSPKMVSCPSYLERV